MELTNRLNLIVELFLIEYSIYRNTLMESASQLIKNISLWRRIAGTDIKKNSRNVTVWDMKCEEAMDVDGDVFRDVKAKAQRPEGLIRKVSMRFYGKGESSKAWVQCSCEWFKYVCEVSLWKEKSSDIKYSNGENPVVKNPSEIPMICKHICAVLRAGALEKKPDISWVKKQHEIQKKEKEEKGKEKERKDTAKQREKDRQKKLQDKLKQDKTKKDKIQQNQKREKDRLDRLRKYKQEKLKRDSEKKIQNIQKKERTKEIEQKRKDQAQKAKDRFEKTKKFNR